MPKRRHLIIAEEELKNREEWLRENEGADAERPPENAANAGSADVNLEDYVIVDEAEADKPREGGDVTEGEEPRQDENETPAQEAEQTQDLTRTQARPQPASNPMQERRTEDDIRQEAQAQRNAEIERRRKLNAEIKARARAEAKQKQGVKDNLDEKAGKGSKFDKFVDKFFKPGPNADYFDIFTLAGLALYGALKLVSVTRKKYKEHRKQVRLSDAVQRKTDAIRRSRNRNADKATSLDQLSPAVQERARKMAQKMISEKNPAAIGKKENDLALDIGKGMQKQQDLMNDQNSWLTGWRKNVEKELRDEIERGQRPGRSSYQFTKDYVDYVNSDLYLNRQVNARLEQYVREAVAEDPGLDGRQNELRDKFFDTAWEQALTDRQIINDSYNWQQSRRAEILNGITRQYESVNANRNENVNTGAPAAAENEAGRNAPVQEGPELLARDTRNEAQRPTADARQGRAGDGNRDHNEISAPKADVKRMPRWWAGTLLDAYLQSELKEPPHGAEESKERKEFRESVERLAKATKDPRRKGDMLVKEYCDVYVKAYSFNTYLDQHPGSPEANGQGTEFSRYVVNELDRNDKIGKYSNLSDMNQQKVNEIAQGIARGHSLDDREAVLNEVDKNMMQQRELQRQQQKKERELQRQQKTEREPQRNRSNTRTSQNAVHGNNIERMSTRRSGRHSVNHNEGMIVSQM